MVCNIPWVTWGQLSRLCLPPISHAPQDFLPASWKYKKREDLDIMQKLLSNNKTISILSMLFSAQIQITAPTSHCEEN